MTHCLYAKENHYAVSQAQKEHITGQAARTEGLIPAQPENRIDSLDIYQLSLYELSLIKITSATKVSQDARELPMTLHIISREQIRERGYIYLEDALADLPGFQFRNIQSINSYVFQRGIPNQNNLSILLIDGIPVNELNSGGFYAGAQFNLAAAERIEIIHGPASAVYGTNAVSGIINIITRDPDGLKAEMRSMAGSFSTYLSDFYLSWSHEKQPFDFQLSGRAMRSDRGDLRNQAGDGNWTALMDNFEQNYAMDFLLRYGKFSLSSNYMQKQSSGAAYIRAVDSPFLDHGSLWNIVFWNNALRYQKQISEWLSQNTTLYSRLATVRDNSVLYVTDTAQIGFFRPNQLLGIESIWDARVSKHFSLTSGFLAEYEKLANGYGNSFSGSAQELPPRPERPEMLGNSLLSFFIEPRVEPRRGLFLSGGLRLDQSSIYDQVITPRFGVSYIIRQQSMRFSYSEAFRAPKPWDYTDGLGNIDLKPEEMKSAELAFRLFPKPWLRLDLSLYRNELDNAISQMFTPDGGYFWGNRGKVQTRGLELMSEFKSGQNDFQVGYTWTDSRDELGKSLAEISRHMLFSTLTYRSENGFWANLRFHFTGKREASRPISTSGDTRLDPSFVVNASLGYTHRSGLEMQLISRNLLNEEYYHPSNRPPARYRQPQRMILFSVAYRYHESQKP